MPRTTRARRHEHGAGLHWRDVASLCLVAMFALQGVVAQGHTHTRSAGVSVAMFGDVVIAGTDAGGGVPSAPESSSCGLCQSLSGGTAPLPLTIVLLMPPLPEAGPEPRFVGVPVFTVHAVSYFWTSRGPPLSTPLHA